MSEDPSAEPTPAIAPAAVRSGSQTLTITRPDGTTFVLGKSAFMHPNKIVEVVLGRFYRMQFEFNIRRHNRYVERYLAAQQRAKS